MTADLRATSLVMFNITDGNWHESMESTTSTQDGPTRLPYNSILDPQSSILAPV